MTTKLKLLRTLLKMAHKAYREEHLKVVGNDIKCSNCNQWFSISGVFAKHTWEATHFGGKATCGGCGHISYFNLLAAPVAISCDEDGNF